MALGIALRYVLEALKKPSATKMFCFGIAALDRFKTRLKDYPSYCQHLAAIPHFPSFPAHLMEVGCVSYNTHHRRLFVDLTHKSRVAFQ